MSSNKPRERKCATCRHYQASPLWRKGWCRNPLLYDAQTNHLVEADTLSCGRTFIDYWEAKDGTRAQTAAVGEDGPRLVRRAPSIQMTPTGPGGMPLRTGPGSVAAVQAAPRERAPQLSLVKPVPESEVAGSAQPLPLPTILPSAPTEAIPIPVPTVAGPAPIADESRRTRLVLGSGVILAGLLAAGMVARQEGRPSATLPLLTQLPRTVAAGAPLASVTMALPPTAVPTAVPTPPPPPVLGVGGKAQISGLGNTALNVRQKPGLKTRIVGMVKEGANLEVKGGPQPVDGVVWWEVIGWDSKGTLGWISGKYLKPVP